MGFDLLPEGPKNLTMNSLSPPRMVTSCLLSILFVCVHVCVCERERVGRGEEKEERERERERERMRYRDRHHTINIVTTPSHYSTKSATSRQIVGSLSAQ